MSLPVSLDDCSGDKERVVSQSGLGNLDLKPGQGFSLQRGEFDTEWVNEAETVVAAMSISEEYGTDPLFTGALLCVVRIYTIE